ncbi:MAG TPA: hypothetical protein VLM79_14305 [Kofleriaceae bacterium]|nr:hypothetical protein [Kofleriaceae bacterium]
MTRERVLYVHAESGLLGRPHTALGRDHAFVWIAVDDAVARAAIAGRLPHRVLYFAIEDYQRAMRGLAAVEVERAVDLRVVEWSPDAAGQTLVAVLEDERRRLALAARAGRVQYFDAGLARLSALGSEESKRTLELDRIVELLVYDEALIADELSRAGRAAEAERTTAAARSLAVELAGLGLPNYARALPVTSAFRVVQFAQADPALVATLRAGAIPSLAWDGGLLVSLSVQQHAVLGAGRASRIVAYDTLAFTRAAAQTEAQRRRDVGELLARAPQALSEECARDIDEQRLTRSADKTYLHNSGRASGSLAALLDAQLAEETRELLSSFAPVVPGDLAAAHAAAILDARWFADLARRDGLGQLAAQLERHLDDLTRATALVGA